jgi:amino acid adenylation domain-containing protein
MQIHHIVEGDGDIDERALRAAVETSSEACPGTRLVRRGKQWVDCGRPPKVRVVEGRDAKRPLLESPLLRAPLDGGRNGSCEVLLVRGTPVTVVLRAHHAVMDGRGALIWATELFRALRGEAVEEAASAVTQEEIVAEIAARLNREAPRVHPPLGLDCPLLLGPAPSKARRLLWRRRTIDGTHPGVTAKIAKQVAAFGPGAGRVMVPVDLRPYLPGVRTTGIGMGAVKVAVRAADDWEDVYARLLTALDERQYLGLDVDVRTLDFPLKTLNQMQDAGDTATMTTGMCSGLACVSNLGRVNLADFSAPGFNPVACYHLGTQTMASPPEVDIVESAGRTELTVTWRDGPGAAERVDALLDRIEEDLSPSRNRVWSGNDTRRQAPPATLTQMFAAQVARTPQNVAISGPDGDVTYAELGHRARAIAAALSDRGIGRGGRVGLVAGRSAEAIAAVWGILLAGAAYLPIDSSYPDARITRLLLDAQAPVCLLEPPNSERDCLPAGCTGIGLDTLPRTEPPSWRDVDGDPGDLANLIYTSGSTGTPKGVENEHRGLVNYVRWATREAGIDASTRMPLVASISFDMAGCAIFLSLLSGATVLPVREVNAVTLRDVIENRGATAFAITPSHLELINQAGIQRSRVRVLMLAGELLRRTTALRAREVLGPECRILCQWGPTEAAIINTSHEFDPERDTEPGVPLGRPMDNNTVHLLDSLGRFVSPGDVGEAYIGGVQVARGYLGRPELTRERFVRLADGSRVYRTGDLARLLPGGAIAFIGRIDDQVKVAGHRIEPAEVAQALEEHPHVRQAAVAARSRPGRRAKELVGYVVCDTGVSDTDLKQHLAERLPRYLIPAAIVTVDAIPTNPNGKADLRRLPDPFAELSAALSATSGGHTHADPVTSAVAGIWARALQVDPQSIEEHTDFHQIGGDSILLLSMLSEVSRSVVTGGQQEFMNELAQILSAPTLGHISELARQISAKHQPQL